MKFIMIYVTHKNTEEAEKIVSELLNERLIACANFFPITSQYWWKDKVEKSDEIVSVLKTKTENWEKVKTYIKKKHSYEIPCIINMGEIEANDEYVKWINEETKYGN